MNRAKYFIPDDYSWFLLKVNWMPCDETLFLSWFRDLRKCLCTLSHLHYSWHGNISKKVLLPSSLRCIFEHRYCQSQLSVSPCVSWGSLERLRDGPRNLQRKSVGIGRENGMEAALLTHIQLDGVSVDMCWAVYLFWHGRIRWTIASNKKEC